MNHDHCCMEELDESVPDMSGNPSNEARVCPNCKDPNFKFREIQNKMVKNLSKCEVFLFVYTSLSNELRKNSPRVIF